MGKPSSLSGATSPPSKSSCVLQSTEPQGREREMLSEKMVMQRGSLSLGMSKRSMLGPHVPGPACARQSCIQLKKLSRRKMPLKGRTQVVVSAESRGGFTTGFVVGGMICGVLGFLYAPQISRALLDEQERLKLPFLNEESPDLTIKDDLVTRVDELNAAVDDLTATINSAKTTTEQTA